MKILYIFIFSFMLFNSYILAGETQQSAHSKQEASNLPGEQIAFNQSTLDKLNTTLQQVEDLLSMLRKEEETLRKKIAKQAQNREEAQKANSLWIEKRKLIAMLENRKKQIQALIASISNEIKRIKNNTP